MRLKILKLFNTKAHNQYALVCGLSRDYSMLLVYMMPLMFARKAYDTESKSRVLFGAVLIN